MKRTMKKMLSFGLVAAMSLTMLAGCGNSKDAQLLAHIGVVKLGGIGVFNGHLGDIRLALEDLSGHFAGLVA